MTAGAGHALEQALAYYRAPALLPMARNRPLPDDVIHLLRLAAGDEGLAGQSAAASGEDVQSVVEAAVFFVQQILFAPGSDSHRVLGVNPGAPDARIKEHYRWLVRWLHPDRNTDEWDSVYADRVTRAWSELRRRSAGLAMPVDAGVARRATGHDDWADFSDQGPTAAGITSAASEATHFEQTNKPVEKPTPPQRIPREHSATPHVSSRTAQRLPIIVFTTLGMIAGATLTLMWYAQFNTDQARRLPSVPESPDHREKVGAASGATELPSLVELPSPIESAVPLDDAPVPEGIQSEDQHADVLPDFAPSDRPQVAADAAPTDAALRQPIPSPVGAGSAATKVLPHPNPVAAEGASTEHAAPDSHAILITEAEAQAVLARFTNAYAAGNLNELMRVFTRDATNNRGGRNEIAYDYQSLFARSSQRSLRLDSRGWVQHADSATVLAKYQADVTLLRKRSSKTSRGDIRFDFRQEDGVLKISRIRHDS